MTTTTGTQRHTKARRRGTSKLRLVSPYTALNKIAKFTPSREGTAHEQVTALAEMDAYLCAGGATTTERYYKDAVPPFCLYALVSGTEEVRHAISNKASRTGVVYQYQGIAENFGSLDDIPPSVYETDLERMKQRGEG